MVLDDDQRVVLPGTLDPAELDPYGEEGQLLSAADQLNRLKERALAGELPKPATPVVPPVSSSPEGPSRKEQRSERKAVRAALKSVKLTLERRSRQGGRARRGAPPARDGSVGSGPRRSRSRR